MRRLILALTLLAAPAAAQDDASVVVSAAPERVAVTLYRDPDRPADRAMQRAWLQGYALVTETRTVAIPAGRATIRFEGVAAGLFPESALVTGLPAGVREKNLDADLLSPGSLYARSLGRPVVLRRTDPRTGAVREEAAVIRSGPDGAAIVQTRDGFEAATCGPLQDSLVYRTLPAGLSARPTLSVETESPRAATATLSLSYLAWGFDWQANYVLTMAGADARKANLDAWVTLASSDSTSFPDAETALVAGRANRVDSADSTSRPRGSQLVFRCFLAPVPPPMPMLAPPPPPMMMEAADIVVSAQRAAAPMSAPVTVVQEGLGDLKLYRVPIPTTVAALAQKQVALAQRRGVAVAPFVRADVYEGGLAGPVRLMLKARNRKEDGLGLPLPGGPVTVFAPRGEALVLVGEGGVPDRAVGEDVEIAVGVATQVAVDAAESEVDARERRVMLTLSNARAQPVLVELRVVTGSGTVLAAPTGKPVRKGGRDVWMVTVPANGRSRVAYTLRRPE